MSPSFPEVIQIRFEIQAADFPILKPERSDRYQIVFSPKVFLLTGISFGYGNDTGLAAEGGKKRAVLAVKHRQTNVLAKLKGLQNSSGFRGVVKHDGRDAASPNEL